MVICLQQGADLHMAQLMPLPLTVSCSNKIQIGFTFLVPAHLGSPGQRAVKQVCVCVYINKRPRWQDVIELDEAGLAIVVINLLNTLVEECEVSRPTRCQRTQPITAERSLLDEVTECLGADQQRIESLVRSVDATKKTYHSTNKYHNLYHCLSKLLLLYHKAYNTQTWLARSTKTTVQIYSYKVVQKHVIHKRRHTILVYIFRDFLYSVTTTRGCKFLLHPFNGLCSRTTRPSVL